MRKRQINFRGQKQGNKTRPTSECEMLHFGKIETETKEQPKALYLVMQKKWFDEIESGRKIEEYRDKTAFYVSRFCNMKNEQIQSFKNYKTVILQEGYHMGARRMILEIDGITLESCFIIHLGAILDRQNFNKL